MKLLAVAGDIGATIADIRLVSPLRALCQRQDWPLTLRSFFDCTRADLAAADVLVVQRGMSARALRLQRAMRQRGGAVLYDIDDLLTEIAPHISSHAVVSGRQRWLRECLMHSDAVSVSTVRLGDLLAESLTLPATVVVPNPAPPPEALPVPAQDAGPVTLLVASSDHLAADFVLPALRLAQQRGARLVVVGPPAAVFEAAGLQVQREGLRARAEFLALARRLPNPLAIIPLEQSRFAAGKSAVKWFDYAEIGVPALASDVSPYREVVASGQTGWLVPNESAAWTAALLAALADPVARSAVAAAARAEVRQARPLSYTLDAWQQALTVAQQQRQARPVAPSSRSVCLRDAVVGVLEDAWVGLRGLNRARLARRQRQRSGATL